MSKLVAAGHALKLAARTALLARPGLRYGRFSPVLRYSQSPSRVARICTAAAPARAAVSQSQARESIKAAHNTFYAPEGVQFDHLALQPAIVQALLQAGFVRPSTVQVLQHSTFLCMSNLCMGYKTQHL